MTYQFAIDDRIEAAARSGAIFALNLSGGKDSTMAAHAANAILDRLGHDRSRRLAIHADLGRAEWKSTPSTIEAQARQIGLPLVVTRRTAGDMVAQWEQRYEDGWALYQQLKLGRLRGPWSSSAQRFCTSGQKRETLHKYLSTTYPGATIVSVLGIRHEESAKRARTPISKVDTKLHRKRAGTNGILWHPAVHITTDQVFAYHAQHALLLHEAYRRYNASRLSCAYCVIASLRDLKIAASVPANQDLFHLLVDMEITTGFSFRQGGWLADVAPNLLSRDQELRLAAAKTYAAERREIEAHISGNFLETSSGLPWPLRMPSHDDAAAIAEARRLNSCWTGRGLQFLTTAAVNDEFARVISARRVGTAVSIAH
ncbi:phosphoadenosine phosphosulfate reductase family protein [Sphingosinicella sp. BN140058]|uniref:phosphoadenosine phosphosulfate reductase domain-containing protein n=1 Tax=Sphingosinicella sp. BN140058 TaxID=1892855 RepID=UPI0010116BF7|nr:phosphoadenosine phosphosulfate reductase family protein [Sphingosinicella sp. BN140058]QAY80472.1 phosphoadenosine phosphosulfate reductase [Sphingosinicella sp. BN140058]